MAILGHLWSALVLVSLVSCTGGDRASTRPSPAEAPGEVALESAAYADAPFGGEFTVRTQTLHAPPDNPEAPPSPILNMLRHAGWVEGFAVRVESADYEGFGTVHRVDDVLPTEAAVIAFEFITERARQDPNWSMIFQDGEFVSDDRKVLCRRGSAKATAGSARPLLFELCALADTNFLAYMQFLYEGAAHSGSGFRAMEALQNNLNTWRNRK